MRKNYGYTSNQQDGRDTTSQDYHSHIASIERMPSVVTDFPHYPSVHKAFKNNYTSEEQQEQPPKGKKSPTKGQKKVQLTDQPVEIIGSGATDENCPESIDCEADGFINKKRKGFELCKWKTFKLHEAFTHAGHD